jgi:hypothetical protein
LARFGSVGDPLVERRRTGSLHLSPYLSPYLSYVSEE